MKASHTVRIMLWAMCCECGHNWAAGGRYLGRPRSLTSDSLNILSSYLRCCILAPNIELHETVMGRAGRPLHVCRENMASHLIDLTA